MGDEIRDPRRDLPPAILWGGLASEPTGVATNAAGEVYVSVFHYDHIEKFDGTGAFLTTWGSGGSGDGQFDSPTEIATDASGNVYVVDYGNNRIQKFGCP